MLSKMLTSLCYGYKNITVVIKLDTVRCYKPIPTSAFDIQEMNTNFQNLK